MGNTKLLWIASAKMLVCSDLFCSVFKLSLMKDMYFHSKLTWCMNYFPFVPGGPDEIKMYSETILTGVIDTGPPKQYGKELPLRNDLIVGEELVIIFTESLDCETPIALT